MRHACALAAALLLLAAPAWGIDIPANTSAQTKVCLDCHAVQTPGIVHDWLRSRHSRTVPKEALTRPELERRISAQDVPPSLSQTVVGCYECHTLRAKSHRDNFEHFGRAVNVIVTPEDCATCHPVEAGQYAGSKKAQAWGTLMRNPVYNLLMETVDSVKEVEGGRLKSLPATEETKWETCLGCHGTKVEVKGLERRQTAIGSLEVPRLTNWPNQGTGRLNPDGSQGSCASCHARHAFSIADARHPYTCGQCHLEPDVPGWNVYKESKHGNIYEAREASWNYEAVPWRVGRDFQAPTCAACHNSLVVGERGEVIAQRTHDFGSRLWVRLFGLIYSHPQPRQGATWEIRNAEGAPLPTTFEGVPAEGFLIGLKEQAARQEGVERVCRGCHSGSWTAGHFAKLAATNRETDRMVGAATKLMQGAWQAGLADPKNPFDEAVEMLWVRQWLFYANSVRYSSAMSGAPDYAAFKNGWWNLTETLTKLAKEAAAAPATAGASSGTAR
jgi:hypothetical protein